ncbi:MAG: glycoside hydrolase family 3 C-terminal domain-containing protein, partial [Bryobacteraceae bacterium]
LLLGAWLLLPLSAPCFGQAAGAPAINPGGIVSAASYGTAVAPGSIAAVFGNFLLSSPSWASTLPLPTNLSQLSMQFDGALAVPLFYTDGGQVNIQIPWELAGHERAMLTVTVNGQTSAPQAIDLVAYAPGIFTTNMQGSGQGAILDLSNRLVDPSNPATAGSTVVVIYCTGLGAVTNRPASASASSVNPLAVATNTPAVSIGGAPAQVLFAGLVPGMVGEYQVNALVPVNSATGDAVPVTISVGGYTSNAATIAVQAPSAQMDPDYRAGVLLAQMTQDEKLQLVHGAGGPVTNIPPLPRGAGGFIPEIRRLGIPALYFVDGSVGLADASAPATALPSSIASAASWDLGLAYKYGSVIGAEMRAYGLNVNLGGNVNLTGREPRDGRTFETKGEDPILAGRITAAHIRAIQDQHVVGGIKHYALNDQETGRTTANAQIEERGARESDLLAFEIGLKDSNVQSVMCSYNLVNGVYACQNPHLLNEVLKGDWGFRGFVMSDWWATPSTAAAALAGLDQEQPDNAFFGSLGQAIARGQVPQSRLDDMVHRILRAMYQSGLFDFPEALAPVDTATGQAIAQEAEEQGAVLLKNAGAQLPLDASSIHSIAVIGSHADVAVLSGGGSAQVWPTGGPARTDGRPNPPGWSWVVWDPSSPLSAIRAKAPQATVRFDDGTNRTRAASTAASSEVAIVFVSQWASEGMDLPSLNFTDVINATPIDQDALVAAVAAANPHTIVVLENGGAQVMPWLGSVSAVLEAWYPGQRGGEAIANLLFGAVNPSGKLPMTFPASVADLPHPTIASPPNNSTTPFLVDYSEGFNVGYKWSDANNLTPLFPFGFGLSYTTFSFSNPRLVDNLASGNPNFRVTFDLKNMGPVAGAEVAQVYLGLPASTGEPPRRLVGWQKVFLESGALQHVTVEVDQNDSSHPMSYWDTGSHSWRIAPGDYTVYLGNSSASASLTVVGTLHVGP